MQNHKPLGRKRGMEQVREVCQHIHMHIKVCVYKSVWKKRYWDGLNIELFAVLKIGAYILFLLIFSYTFQYNEHESLL